MAFQRRRVHSHQDVGEVARRMHALANVHLKSRDTAQSALRSADFSRIVGESGDLVAHARRHVRENVAGELHTVARVARKADHYILQGLNVCLF